jgi:large subunit ribosomal protein L22e
MAPKTNKKGKKIVNKFSINCSVPVADGIFDIASFEKFLHDKIKVDGKAGVLGDSVKIVRGAQNVDVTANIAMSKRYLKYLTKKFLKKQQLRDYLRVIASSKSTYDLRYFNINEDANADE